MSRIFVKPNFQLVPKPGGFVDQAGEWVNPKEAWVIARLAERDVVVADPPGPVRPKRAAPQSEKVKAASSAERRAPSPRRSMIVQEPARQEESAPRHSLIP